MELIGPNFLPSLIELSMVQNPVANKNMLYHPYCHLKCFVNELFCHKSYVAQLYCYY